MFKRQSVLHENRVFSPRDVLWCTADVAWVTGHSYVCYGPLACGATGIIFEGVPVRPDAGRFWKMIQDHKVTVFYTAPTAIRALIKAGGDLPIKSSRLCRTGRPRKSALLPIPSPSPRTCASVTACPKHGPAKSCGGCRVPSPRAKKSRRTCRRWRTRPFWIDLANLNNRCEREAAWP